jgi:hypothetical protein
VSREQVIVAAVVTSSDVRTTSGQLHHSDKVARTRHLGVSGKSEIQSKEMQIADNP